MMRHILFATDGSDYATGAQALAIALARRHPARLTAMSVVLGTQDLEGVGTHHLREAQEQAARRSLDAVAAAARAAGIDCATRLAYGETPEREIVATAGDLEADLIVLGRRGKRGLARFMVGHATAWVAGHAPCDVLVVPRAASLWQGRVLLATDGSPHGAAALRATAQLASQDGLPVTVVSATTESHNDARRAAARAAVDDALAELGRAGIACDGLVAEGRPDAVVVGTAESRGAGLIVTGSHGRTGLARLVLGSISERIIGQAACPVLVARGAA